MTEVLEFEISFITSILFEQKFLDFYRVFNNTFEKSVKKLVFEPYLKRVYSFSYSTATN